MHPEKPLSPPVFKEYPAEKLITHSLRSRLEESESVLRMDIINRLIDSGGPLPVALLLAAHTEGAGLVLQRLQNKKVIVLDDTGEHILFVYPVSALPTPHRVNLADGRSFFAMCAIDSMGAAFTLDQDTVVHSQCSACGAPVSLAVQNRELGDLQPESLHIIHVDLNESDNWASSC